MKSVATRLHANFKSLTVMPLIPSRFLVRLLYACPYVKDMPLDDEDSLIDLPESARLDPFADIDGAAHFADVRLGWNETGLGFTVEAKGKDNFPIGDVDRPRQSDGVTLWIDTRGDRTSHRATRTCQQFHFLAAGEAYNKDEPAFVQTKIHRALQDAPLATSADVPFRYERLKGGYRIEAFLSANVWPASTRSNIPASASSMRSAILKRESKLRAPTAIFLSRKTRRCGRRWNWSRRPSPPDPLRST